MQPAFARAYANCVRVQTRPASSCDSCANAFALQSNCHAKRVRVSKLMRNALCETRVRARKH
eukprot:4129827-Lingulodinium_polyedra.AAC.1